jgi:hypothetical protein
MNIENSRTMDPAQLQATLEAMDEPQLIGQGLVQQGAVHAISYLIKIGCTEENAAVMLASLRSQGKLVTAEAARRGLPHFQNDQIAFD